MKESKNLKLEKNCVHPFYQILMDFPGTKSKILLIFQIQNLNTLHVLYIAKLPSPVSFDDLYDHLVEFKMMHPQMPSLFVCTPEKVLLETSLAVFRDCQIQICLDSFLNWIKKTSNNDDSQELERDITKVLYQKDLNRFVQTYTFMREKWKNDRPCLMDEMDEYLCFIIPMYQYQIEIRPIISTIEYAQSQLFFIHNYLKEKMDVSSSEKMETNPYQINSYLQSLPLELKVNLEVSS